MTDEPTPDDLREAAEARKANAQSEPRTGKSATSYFTSPSVRSASKGRDHTLPPIRCTEDFAQAVADFGNANQLNLSDSVRSLVELGLQHSEDPDE